MDDKYKERKVLRLQDWIGLQYGPSFHQEASKNETLKEEGDIKRKTRERL